MHGRIRSSFHRLQRCRIRPPLHAWQACDAVPQLWQIVQALIPHAAGEGHLEVAWWGPCMHGSLRRRRLGGGVVVPHVSEEKATSRWPNGPRSRYQLHSSARVAPQTDQTSSR
ncbi:hypothetical protein V6N13_130129 [Hibiscus sabdariffa]|uniref:Uncharacterized protein n=1 Tax=Hibiscus sabdariffa TaxID=183260 RepID=A0ABR2SP24_9ROSI